MVRETAMQLEHDGSASVSTLCEQDSVPEPVPSGSKLDFFFAVPSASPFNLGIT